MRSTPSKKKKLSQSRKTNSKSNSPSKGLLTVTPTTKKAKKSASLFSQPGTPFEEFSFQDLKNQIPDPTKITSPQDKKKMMKALKTLSSMSTVRRLELEDIA